MVTVPLVISGTEAETVFDLLGSAENDLTYALGWALSRAPHFAEAVMADLFPHGYGELLGVSLQRFGPDRGYTDVEVMASEAHLIVEAKKGWQIPNEIQLSRYSARPEGDVSPLLLSVSAASRDWALRRLPPSIDVVRVDHRSWADLAALAETSARTGAHGSRHLLQDLVHYLKGVSRLQNVSSNWAYCVALSRREIDGLTGDLLDVPLVHRAYFHPYAKAWPRVPPNYMAFRWDGRVRQFNHVESAVVVDDLSEALPELLRPGAIVGPHAVYQLGPPVELSRPLRNGRIYATAHVWVMIDLLFTSDTLKDAQVASQERRRAVGAPAEPEE